MYMRSSYPYSSVFAYSSNLSLIFQLPALDSWWNQRRAGNCHFLLCCTVLERRVMLKPSRTSPTQATASNRSRSGMFRDKVLYILDFTSGVVRTQGFAKAQNDSRISRPSVRGWFINSRGLPGTSSAIERLSPRLVSSSARFLPTKASSQ